MEELVRQILTARVYDVAHETPLDYLPRLSARVGRPVRLKREDLQPVHSFKIRGAYNRITQLTTQERAAGVICASAGNHAQGVALAAQHQGIQATVVMPTTSPAIKIDAVKSFGAKVVLHGDVFDDAYAHARQLEAETGAVFIHPFDDPAVIAGQGTIGVEILKQHPDKIGAVFVPVGGGGLAAGVATITKFLRPGIRIIGVEPTEAAGLQLALQHGQPTPLERVDLFADGVAVKQVGDHTFEWCRKYLDDVITVDTDMICAAIRDIFEDCRAVAEPSGAVALAGLKEYAKHTPEGQSLIAVHSGANVNFNRLRHVAERTELGDGREALLAVRLTEKPGANKAFIEHLGGRQITAFSYRFNSREEARLLVGVSLNAREERPGLIEQLRQGGFAVIDLSDNEAMKTHVRFMVGGVSGVKNERVYRFRFPERPGALLDFLEALDPSWNLTAFHYRYHGADYGRVLAGIEAPKEAKERVAAALTRLGYPFTDETDNPAMALFLGRTENGEPTIW